MGTVAAVGALSVIEQERAKNESNVHHMRWRDPERERLKKRHEASTNANTAAAL